LGVVGFLAVILGSAWVLFGIKGNGMKRSYIV
jgi:hypothetical protein